jgi:hypothetical protein
MSMHDDDDRRNEWPPDPPIVDIRDWPPKQHSEEVREQLDREVGTLGVTGNGEPTEEGVAEEGGT